VARVFVTRRLAGDALERLRTHADVEIWAGEMPPTRDELVARIGEAEGLLTLLTERVDGVVLDAAPKLRVVSNYAVGFDNIDVEACAARGVVVGTTGDVLTDATADLAMALLLAAARHLPAARDAARAGRWRTWEPQGWVGLELRGARLAIVGAGRIGRAVAQRAQAFGMEVELLGRDSDLRAALARADVVSLHAPLTPDTRHIIDARALAIMRPGTILVNTARGGLVDQAALLDATHVTAAIDVTDPEPPPPGDAILNASHVLVVPHIGSATRAARERMTAVAVDNLLAGLAGEPLPHPAG
jgi:phosphoglycerate dehydrogenase-like enzyme